jgi:glycosyltransferase involved in cell wall biosynthesis
MVHLSIVIPFYDEEECAERVVRDLVQALRWRPWSSELVLIDNGSSDATASILAALAAELNQPKRWPRLRILSFAENRGYGGAIRAGLAEATGEILGFTCGDGEVAARDLVRICRRLETGGLDLCKGWRVGRMDGVFRLALSTGYHWLISKLFLTAVQDINGYPVLMRRKAYAQLELKQDDWIINVEILNQVRWRKLSLEEVIIRHLPRAGGRSHVRWYFPLLFAFELVRYRWRVRSKLRFGRGR